MGSQRSYPGVYITEIPNRPRPIEGVTTSVAAFVGPTRRGPINEPVHISSFEDFERRFGGLCKESTLSHAVSQYFVNGGSDAVVVRVARKTTKATFSLPLESGAEDLKLEASSEGDWGNRLRVWVAHERDTTSDLLFNLFVKEIDPSNPNVVIDTESFFGVSVDGRAPRSVGEVLETKSRLLRVRSNPLSTMRPLQINEDSAATPATPGHDGETLTSEDYEGSRDDNTGIYALENTDIFNILCIPPFNRDQDVDYGTWTTALHYCKERHAMLIVNPSQTWTTVEAAISGVDAMNLRDANSTMFFPCVKIPDPLKGNQLDVFAPCGVVAGVFARTDTERGVWKAPAGMDANLFGVHELTLDMTDAEAEALNSHGINALRSFPGTGSVAWGSRTLEGTDHQPTDYKYIPVRRLALFIENSLYRGTRWVVFEGNDESLWAQIRSSVSAFLECLFHQGALAGTSAREAYLVECDNETTTEADVKQGIVNIRVGFAPLKPAEFVTIKISQSARPS